MMKKLKLIYKKLKEYYFNLSERHVVHDFCFRYKERGMASGFQSQRGQDYYILSELLSFKKNGFFVEVGANHPLIDNNSLVFEKRYNWTGIAIDPIPKFKDLWTKERKVIFLNECISSQDNLPVEFTEIISDDWQNMLSGIDVLTNNKVKLLKEKKFKNYILKTRRLDSILKDHDVLSIDVLFIDTEGFERNVLEGIDFERVSIFCICLENDDQDKDLRNYLLRRKYRLCAHIMGDDIFIKESNL